MATDNHELASLKVNLDLQGTGTFTQNLAKANRATKLYDTALQAVTAGANKFERSLEDMNKISTLTEKKLDAQKQKADELKREYERLVAEKGVDAKETQNMLIRYTKTVAQMKKTELALGSVNKQIQEQSSSYAQVAKVADKAVSSIEQDLKVLDAQYKATNKGAKNMETQAQHLSDTLELQQKAANELSKKYAALRNEKGADAEETKKALIAYQNSITTMNKTKQSLGEVQESLREQSSEFGKASKAAETALSSIEQDLKVVNSQFAVTEAGAGDLGEAADMLREKSEHLNRVLSLEAKAVEALKKKYEAAKRERGENDKATKDSLVAMNEAIQRLNRTQRALEEVDDALEDAGRGWTLFGRRIQMSSERMEELQQTAKETGRTMGNALALGAAAGTVGVTKLASEVEGTQKRIQGTLDVTAQEAVKLNKVARSAWKEGFGENMGEVENSLVKVKLNMKNLVKDSELKTLTQDSMLLAERWESDVNEVTRASSNLMRGFGIDSKKAYDLMAWGARNGLNFSQEMFDNLSEYSPLFAKMGFSAEEYFQLLEKGSQAGVYNLDFINDAMKEAQIRFKDGSDTTANAMAELSKGTQKIWKDFLAGKSTVKDVHNAVIKDLKNMDDQTAANNLGVSLYGTKWEDLESTAMYAMGNIDGKLQGVDGSMGKVRKSMDTTAVRAKQVFREFLDSVAPLGESFLNVAERILPRVESAVETTTGWFNKLSPAMQDTVAVGGLLTAAAIPLISAVATVGRVVAPVTGLLGGMGTAAAGAGAAAGGAATGAGLFGGALAALTGPVGWTIGAVAALGVGYVALDKQMDKPVMKSQIFSDKISESTQKAVGAYLKLEKDASESLSRMAWGQQTITDNMVNSITSKYQAMGDSILSKMDANHIKQKEKTQKLFNDMSALTEAEEQKILANMDTKNEQKKAKVQAYEDRIKEIMNKAKEEKRAITDKEYQEIQSIQEKMRTSAVTTMSKSKQEQTIILGQLKNEASKLSAEQAANVVKKSLEQKNKSVKAAEDQYDGTTKQIRYMRDVTGTLTKQQADKLLDEAERQKDGAIDDAEAMHKKVVKEAKNQAGEHADEIDFEKGEVLNGWDKMMNGIEKAMNWIAGLFGKKDVKKKPSVKDSSTKKNGKGRATGTPNGGVPYDQVALTGEEGPELVKDGRTGKLGLVGVNGPQHTFLSKGSAVLPAHHTKNALKKYGFTSKGKKMGKMPAYKDGIATDAFEWIMQGPEAVWDKAINMFDVSDKVMPDWWNNHTGGILDYAGKMAIDKIQGWIDEAMQFFEGSPISEYYLKPPWRLTSKMGPRWGTMHNGIDLAAPPGYPIKSLTDGVVSQVLKNNKTAGNGVRVRSGDKEFSYIHMIGIPNVVEGQKVKAGDILGGVGNTGASKGNHLDLKIKQNGKYIDPWEYLNNAFGGGPSGISGNITSWQPVILKAAKEMKEEVTAKQVKGILAQIQRESNGNEKIVQSSALRDINVLMGNPAKGLLQYIPQSFSRYAMPGHKNIFSGYDQLLAFFNNTKWQKDLRYGKSGWGPTGKRKFGYAKGGVVDSHQFAELGENGYKEYVLTTEPRYRNRSLALLTDLMKDLGVYNPVPKVAAAAPSSPRTNGQQTVQEQPQIIIQNTFQVSYEGLPDRESVKKFMDMMDELAEEKAEQQLRSRGLRR
ncbi:peptidoglycan DD-metalloendopeptidase family protein [Priestia endophytica]|uniref:peptidoglycan DD-metalloendopeptidase family protein n=1 Tax=Priestia endophytica TaxID=135735 RepID=UPI0020426997|nr:peptidoglycan DD-metalloendopeptidase family protein [Priestia endophytica]MCM3536601.1 peptidoglycan DD-metalloendopeptidase family protein [Priestia endophytica]